MHLRSSLVVAALYAFPAFAVIGIWYILLSSTGGSRGVLDYVLGDAPERLWFRWMLVAPILWVAVALAHLTSISERRAGTVALTGVGASLAVAAWFTFTFEIALLATLPLVYRAGRMIELRR